MSSSLTTNRKKARSGLNPVWKETFVFNIDNPDLAFLRFVVNEEDMFGDANFLAQATYPVKCLRQGSSQYPPCFLRIQYFIYYLQVIEAFHLKTNSAKSWNWLHF